MCHDWDRVHGLHSSIYDRRDIQSIPNICRIPIVVTVVHCIPKSSSLWRRYTLLKPNQTELLPSYSTSKLLWQLNPVQGLNTQQFLMNFICIASFSIVNKAFMNISRQNVCRLQPMLYIVFQNISLKCEGWKQKLCTTSILQHGKARLLRTIIV